MTRKIHIYASLPSTNKKAYELAVKGAKAGEVILARSQSAGRGRLGKSWQSPAGKGLYFSLIVRPDLDIEEYPKITMTTGLAIANALQPLSGKEILLKWPNDIYLSGRKCCGILAESSLLSGSPAERFAIIGIGINVLTVRTDFPVAIRGKATSLLIETGIRFDMDKLLSIICDGVLDQISRLECSGFKEILNEWRRKDILKDRWLKWVTNSGDVIAGRSEGPDDNGQLLVRDAKGVLHQVISGDISIAEGE